MAMLNASYTERDDVILSIVKDDRNTNKKSEIHKLEDELKVLQKTVADLENSEVIQMFDQTRTILILTLVEFNFLHMELILKGVTFLLQN